MNNFLDFEYQDILSKVKDFWPKNSKILLTGMTGVFGYWFLHSIAFVEERLASNNIYYVTGRRSLSELNLIKELFAEEKIFNYIQIDLGNSSGLDLTQHTGLIDYILFGADEVQNLNLSDENLNKKNNVENLFNCWQFQIAHLKNFVYLSSGAVYQVTPEKNYKENSLDLSKDINLFGLNSRARYYIQNKIESEKFLKKIAFEKNVPIQIARCFSFLGPYLSENMALSCFVNAKLRGDVISVKSPHVLRSYMNWADLVVLISRMLFDFKAQAKFDVVNIGSDVGLSMVELANKINSIYPNTSSVKIQTSDCTSSNLGSDSYVPNLNYFNEKFNNYKFQDLNSSLKRWLDFERKKIEG